MAGPGPTFDPSSEVSGLDSQIDELEARAKPLLEQIKVLRRRRRTLLAAARSAAVRAERVARKEVRFRALHSRAGGDRAAASQVIAETGVPERTFYRHLGTVEEREARKRPSSCDPD